MKRTVNRLLARLAMLGVAVILGAIAVAQAQRGLETSQNTPLAEPPEAAPPASAAPIPLAPNSGEVATHQPADHGQPPADWGPAGNDPGYGVPPAQFGPPSPEMAEPPPSYDQANVYGQPTPYDQDSNYGEYASEDPAPPTLPPAAYDSPPTAYDRQMAFVANPSRAATAPPAEYAVADDEPTAAPPAAESYLAEPAVQYVPAEATDRDVQFAAAEEQRRDDDSGVAPLLEPSSGYEDYAPRSAPHDDLALPPASEFGNTDESAHVPDSGFDPVPGEFGGGGPDFANDTGEFGSDTSNYGGVPPAGGSDTPTPASPYGGGATLTVAGEREYANTALAPARTQASVAEGMTGKGKPGPKELEGTQLPSLSVSKVSPAEIQVGKPAEFKVIVRNVGKVDAHDVLVRDEIPHGTELIETEPAAGKSSDGAILWQLGTIRAGSESTVTMQVMPQVEGEIGSVATVSFQTTASSRSVSTRAQLALEHTAARQVLIGDDVVFNIKLSNPGTGVATHVVIEEDVPEGLEHLEGRELEYPIGTLRPGETRLLELTLKADQPGMVDNLLTARADASILVEDRCQVEIVAPMLQIGLEGPRRRYLERKADYQIRVANPGTAAATNVQLVARLPRGLKFDSTNNAGQYRKSDHSVHWNLAELPPQEMGTVQLTAIPVEMGNHRIRVEGKANLGLVDDAEQEVTIEGLAALLFTLTDANDPIEVGEDTTYDIHVVNQGSKNATNVRLLAIAPPGMQPINGEGQTRATVEGQRVLFEPLARLAPQADAFYKVHMKGTLPGDQRIQVKLISDELDQPVTKEESTRVYSDE